MDGYDKEGPFSTKAVHTRADVAPSTALPITLTFPKQALTNGTDNTLWPLVMLINGFKVRNLHGATFLSPPQLQSQRLRPTPAGTRSMHHVWHPMALSACSTTRHAGASFQTA